MILDERWAGLVTLAWPGYGSATGIPQDLCTCWKRPKLIVLSERNVESVQPNMKALYSKSIMSCGTRGGRTQKEGRSDCQ